jgi:predicted aldo/keto reductase-like oxidoreductase
MEPLRGGKLVSKLPEEAKRIFEKYPVRKTPAEWAFSWLWNQPEVTVVLSGMNSYEMVSENVATASNVDVGSLSKEDDDMLKSVVKVINAKMKVGCSGCGYCMPCPKGVDIPGTFAAYNRRYSEGKASGFLDYIICTALRKNASCASNCVGCGKCEKHCPQGIPIRAKLNEAKKELETPLFKMAFKFIKKFTNF